MQDLAEPYATIVVVIALILLLGIFFVLPIWWLERKLYDPIQRLLPRRHRHTFLFGARLPILAAAVIWMASFALIIGVVNFVSSEP